MMSTILAWFKRREQKIIVKKDRKYCRELADKYLKVITDMPEYHHARVKVSSLRRMCNYIKRN